MYVPPELYVLLHDDLWLADITAMYVEQFNLFLHYEQEKYLRILMEIALYTINVDFLYISTYNIWFPNKRDENNGFIV